MINYKITSDELASVVMKITGPVDPVGETHEDSKRLKNLSMLCNTLDLLLQEIYNLTLYADGPEYSVKVISEAAAEWLLDTGKDMSYYQLENEVRK